MSYKSNAFFDKVNPVFFNFFNLIILLTFDASEVGAQYLCCDPGS
jgi:hypothetical protein